MGGGDNSVSVLASAYTGAYNMNALNNGFNWNNGYNGWNNGNVYNMNGRNTGYNGWNNNLNWGNNMNMGYGGYNLGYTAPMTAAGAPVFTRAGLGVTTACTAI